MYDVAVLVYHDVAIVPAKDLFLGTYVCEYVCMYLYVCIYCMYANQKVNYPHLSLIPKRYVTTA